MLSRSGICPGVDHVYLWADGIHVNIRLEEHKLCLLVMIGVRADAARSSSPWPTGTGSRSSLGRICCAMPRGAGCVPRFSPSVTARSGSGVLREVFSQARAQQCWFHKIANVLGVLPHSAHPGAKKALAEIWNAEDKRHALDAVSRFMAAYEAKFPKAVAKSPTISTSCSPSMTTRRTLDSSAHHESHRVYFRHRQKPKQDH
jgi:Transposase, Mutator family